MSTLSGGPDIIKSGLALYLDAGSSNSFNSSSNPNIWKDISRNSNDGTLTNGPAYSIANAGSIVFDGTNDYVSISPSGYNLGVTFTLQIWTKITRFGGGPFDGTENRASLITNSYPYSLNQGFYFVATSQAATTPFSPTPGRETFFISIGQDQFQAAATAGTLTSFVNNWVQLSAVVNSTNLIRLYVNGVEPIYSVQQNGPSSISYTAGPFSVGVRNNISEFLQGSIALVQIYNRALTASEIFRNYDTQKSRFGL